MFNLFDPQFLGFETRGFETYMSPFLELQNLFDPIQIFKPPHYESSNSFQENLAPPSPPILNFNASCEPGATRVVNFHLLWQKL